MTVDDLLEVPRERGKVLDNDRILLSKVESQQLSISRKTAANSFLKKTMNKTRNFPSEPGRLKRVPVLCCFFYLTASWRGNAFRRDAFGVGEQLLRRLILLMLPSSMKMTRLETSRAKPISWVTTSMVMPV